MLARIAIGGIIVSALVAGIALYWLQIYAYYDEVAADDLAIELTSLTSGQPEAILFDGASAIDAESSPLRFRACFSTPMSQALLSETYQTYEDAEPLVAPGWFDCFDADDIGTALQEGTAIAFMGVENIQYGIDRIVAITDDGRGYAWHQINACGEVVFDGRPAPEGCPTPPESLR